MDKLQKYLAQKLNDIKPIDEELQVSMQLELYQYAQNYINLTKQFGCPIEVFMEAIKDGIIIEKYRFDVDPDYDWDDEYVHSNIVSSNNLGLYIDYNKDWFLLLETEDDFFDYKLKDYKKTWWLPSDFKAKLVKGFWRW